MATRTHPWAVVANRALSIFAVLFVLYHMTDRHALRLDTADGVGAVVVLKELLHVLFGTKDRA